MSERRYFFFVGVIILVALYLEAGYLIYGLAAFMILEGLSGQRLTTALQKARNVQLDCGLTVFNTRTRFKTDGLSAWRIVVSIVLVATYAMLYEYDYQILWFFPWFMGFAIMGAGATGVCPVLLGLRWAGFR